MGVFFLKIPSGEPLYSEHFFDKIEFLNIKWKHDKVSMYDKLLPLPRLTSWEFSAEFLTHSGQDGLIAA